MFTIIVYKIEPKYIKTLAEFIVNSSDKAAELSQTLFKTLENVVVEIEDKNGEIIKKFRKTS